MHHLQDRSPGGGLRHQEPRQVAGPREVQGRPAPSQPGGLLREPGPEDGDDGPVPGAVALDGQSDHRRLVGRSSLPRSEEHTSELQSLMRISYAVFCLKKKKNNERKTPESIDSSRKTE